MHIAQRLVFDRILVGLAGWKAKWDEGVGCVPFGGLRYNTDLGAFVEGGPGVRAVAKALRMGKEKVSDGDTGLRMVIVLERAEDLRVKELMVPLARLAELVRWSTYDLRAAVCVLRFGFPLKSGEPVTTLFISEVSWFDIRPPLAAAPDPFLIDVPILSKQGRRITSHPYAPDKHHSHQTPSPHSYHFSPPAQQIVLVSVRIRHT